MKTINSFLLALFVLCQVSAAAQERRVIVKNYDVGTSAGLSINNTFGDVRIEEGSSGRIEATIYVSIDVKNTSQAQKYFDMINIEATKAGNSVSFRTINNLKGNNGIRSFSIDYVVKIPEGTKLDIRNQFGDVTVEAASAQLKLNVQHGDASISDVKGTGSIIKVQFGDLRMKSAGAAEVRIEHGDFDGGDMRDLDLDSQFGDVKISGLSGKSSVSGQHGDVLLTAHKGMSDLNVDVQFGDLDLVGFSQLPADIDANSSFGDISWKGDYKVEKIASGMNNSHFRLLPILGGAANVSIRLHSQHGDINLR